MFVSCDLQNQKNIDLDKRQILVTKYDLMKFPTFKEPVFMSIDEFFDGNNDEASIAPNIAKKPKVSNYYTILKALSQNENVDTAFVKINEVMIYEDGKLNDLEWFFTDKIYIVGNITKEEVKKVTKYLMPDDVYYDNSNNQLNRLSRNNSGRNIICIWWD